MKNTAGSNPYIPGGYAAVMKPKTGGIYALAGVNRDLSTGEVTENALGTINQTFVMGSVVKVRCGNGGFGRWCHLPRPTILLLEEPIKLAGTAAKTSWFNKTGAAK